MPAVDVIVGPGNRWVTAAKQLVAGQVGIDMLAGPSELVIVADDSARADLVAAIDGGTVTVEAVAVEAVRRLVPAY